MKAFGAFIRKSVSSVVSLVFIITNVSSVGVHTLIP